MGEGDDGGGTYTIIYDGVCYAAGGGAWAAYSLDTGAPLVQGILKPRRCRGLGVGAVFGDTAGGRASPLLFPPHGALHVLRVRALPIIILDFFAATVYVEVRAAAQIFSRAAGGGRD